MKGSRLLRIGVVIAALVAIVAATTLEAGAYGRTEFGVGLPISTSFSLSYVNLALEVYGRILLGALAWETALQTNLGFASLYVRNTLATTGRFFLALGHVTGLLPSFGSTYFTFGAGILLGQTFLVRAAVNLALSIGGGFFPFLELRLQFGLDP